MPGDAKPWDGTAWESHVQLLLKTKYSNPPGTYQHIPSTVGGDCGIEGFSQDGCAYQCYSAQDWPSSEVLYAKQRNKLTADITKLCNNATELKKLLGGILIQQWNFVVPYYSDKALIAHAKKKQAEVRKKNLIHLSKEFSVSVLTADDFAIQNQQLANVNLAAFDMVSPPIPAAQLATWMQQTENIPMMSALSRKVALMGPHKSQSAIDGFKSVIVRNYISGNIAMAQLQQNQPETYDRTLEFKVQSEGDLQAESFVTTMVPSDFFKSTLDDYKKNLSSIPGISPRVASTLANEAVADWLLRCPMDFE